jgi:hypothetical protein
MSREEWNTNFKDEFYEGFFALADHFGVTLAGGDISETKDGIVIDSIVLGEVASGAAVTIPVLDPAIRSTCREIWRQPPRGMKLIELGARVDPRSEVRGQRSETGSD